MMWHRPPPVRTFSLVMLGTLLVAGCSHGTAPPAVPPAPIGAQVMVLTTGGNDAPPNYDVILLKLFNLNGSFAINLTMAEFNVSAGHRHPFYNVTFDIDRNDGRRIAVVAALLVDFNVPPPHVRPATIVIEGTERSEFAACQATTQGKPATYLQDMANFRTGLQGGGVVRHVAVEVHDGSGTTYEALEMDVLFAVPGGANPYSPPESANPDADCPLLRDPSSPLHRGA